MMYTSDESGLLNNFAVEPKAYLADYPSPGQQRRYLLQGVAAFVLLATLIGTAFAVS